ncbi:MAG: HD domain-containing protein, partial [Methanocellales archaeon]
MNNVFEAFTLLPAKLQPKITIFQHGVDTYQVVKYLIDKNKDIIQNSDLIRVAALVHDIGKAEQNWQRDQWIHTKHTRKYLEPLLEDKFFVRLIKDRGLKIPEDRELLVRICEEHHNPSPQ